MNSSMHSLFLVRFCTSFTARSSSSMFPLISPLQYIKKPKLDPPQESTTHERNESRSKPRFISHEQAIELIRSEKDPQRALDFFNMVGRQEGFDHNNATYSAILNKFGVCKKFQAIESVIHQMTYETCEFHESIFLNLMKHFSRSNIHEKVLDLFYRIEPIVREKPSMKAVSTCLNLLLQSGEVSLARGLLSTCSKSLSSKPNVCVFNILVKYHCANGDLSSALGVMEGMRKYVTSQPNLITYSTVMGAFCKSGKLKEALNLFEEMISRDNITPDVRTYNVLVNGFCHCGKSTSAKKIMDFMERNGCNPDMFTYSSLMSGYCREGKMEEAMDIFNDMKESSAELDKVGYTTLINFFCRSKKVDEAIELLKELKEKVCRVDFVTVNMILGGLCRVMRFDEALELLRKIPISGDGMCLNRGSYRIVLNSLCRAGEMEKASELLGMMLSRRIIPHHSTSNDLLVRLCDSGKALHASMALPALLSMGFQPETRSWKVLVSAFCGERKHLSVFELLHNLVLSVGEKGNTCLHSQLLHGVITSQLLEH